jgi:hypothetical protein
MYVVTRPRIMTQCPLLKLGLAVAFLWACGGPRPPSKPPASASPTDGTDQIIASLLTDLDQAPAAKAGVSAQSLPAGATSPADSYDEDRERIRSSVPRWDHGTGATLRFLKESSRERLSLIFVDETAPLYQEQAGLWMIQAAAHVTGGKVVGHFVLFLRDLRPGRYRGDDHTRDAVMAVLIGQARWDGQNPETSWSINRESWCEVVLRDAGNGSVDGEIRARLVDNRGTAYINVESGYLFIRP